jgi:hypothetical protein
MSTDRDERTTVDLYVSAGNTAVWNRQANVIERLEQAEAEGRIDHFSVQVWAKKLSVSGPMAASKFHRSAVKSIREFESWAEAHDRDVEIHCERESTTCEFTDAEFHTLRPPAVCVAVYHGDQLSGVCPCTVDDEVRSVEDVLTAIESGDPTHPMSGMGETRTAGPVD